MACNIHSTQDQSFENNIPCITHLTYLTYFSELKVFGQDLLTVDQQTSKSIDFP